MSVGVPACADGGSGDGHGPVVQLSADAQSLFELMHWGGTAVPPTAEQAARLHGVEPAADSAAVEAAARALAGDVFASFRFDPRQGFLDVGTIERELVRGPDLTDEQALRAGVTAVVTAMGASTEQLTLEVDGTTVVGGEQGGAPTAEVLDATVLLQRSVHGLNLGDGGTASFEPTGPLISLHCTWRRVDYDASSLFVEGLASEEAVMAALAELMAGDGFEIEPTLAELEVGVYYRPIAPDDPASDTWTLRLVGYAAIIDTRGGTIPTREFHLDDGTPLTD